MLSLFSRVSEGGRSVGVYEFDGLLIRIHDEADTAFLVIELFADETLTPLTKAELLCRMLFVDPEAVVEKVERLDELLIEACWTICGLDINDEREHGEQVIDWEGDASLINASLYMTYGETFADMRKRFTLPELGELVGLLPRETPMGTALYYRLADPPKRTKHNAEEVAHFHEMRRRFAIGANRAVNSESQNDQATAAFNSIAKAAKRG